MSGIFLCCSSSYCLKPGSLVDVEARLGSQWALGLNLSPVLSTEVAGTCSHAQPFKWVFGVQHQVLESLYMQTKWFYTLRHLSPQALDLTFVHRLLFFLTIQNLSNSLINHNNFAIFGLFSWKIILYDNDGILKLISSLFHCTRLGF